jgi:hypothetical protein
MTVGTEIVRNGCMICGDNQHTEIADRIREGNYKVLKCNCCNFIFLQNLNSTDYSENYGSFTYSSEWSRNNAMIKRSESLIK